MRVMISSHPYRTWPLHVKIFTKEAEKCWKEAMKVADETAPLPAGLTYTVELEGVDGKSGEFGSGRKGPIETNDGTFTSSHLSKQTTLLSQNVANFCMVCKEHLDLATSNPMKVSLCPTPGCTGTAHLICLSRQFLAAQPAHDDFGMIPRGGRCNECHQYVLWGDIIRACHRRRVGGTIVLPDDDDLEEEEDIESALSATDDAAPIPAMKNITRRGKEKQTVGLRGPKRPTKNSTSKGKQKATIAEESDLETFNLDDISGTEDEESLPAVPTRRTKPASTKRSVKPVAKSRVKATVSRPVVMDVDIPVFKSSTNARKPRTTKLSGTKTTTSRKHHTQATHHRPVDDGGEFFDLNAISSDEEEEDAPKAPLAGSSNHVNVWTKPTSQPTGGHPWSLPQVAGVQMPSAPAHPIAQQGPKWNTQGGTRLRFAPGEVDFFDSADSPNPVLSAASFHSNVDAEPPKTPLRRNVPHSFDSLTPSSGSSSPQLARALSALSVSSPTRVPKGVVHPGSSSDVILLSD
ncbi:hypothetical protein BD410DRAFT_781901 [Rickenella mellea]|uniref:Structure-specific endonuclease subunit SLX1 C-terminal domain-containing protein n=1 Tax=Rickenella mellea TaxID=50990 RepID=A0A4Y7QL38_9AGAM|nr:hypothetical protein BD410DRAFT_781901 [Rickenella mellea]